MNTCRSETRWLALLRHGESHKNIEDRHGGIGTALTKAGRDQAQKEALWFVTSQISFEQSWYSDQQQVYETADIIELSAGIPKINHSKLIPFNLGRLAGLSLESAKRLYPKEAHHMEQWRKRKLEIQDLKLPEGDSPLEFYQRGLSVYSDLSESKRNILIIASRSLIILMISVLLGRTPTKGGGYVEIPMKPCDRFVFREENGLWTFVEKMSSGRIQ